MPTITIIDFFMVAWAGLVVYSLWANREYFRHHTRRENVLWVAETIGIMPFLIIICLFLLLFILGLLSVGIRI